MDFLKKRRQQFLSETHFRDQLVFWDEAIAGQKANLFVPEDDEKGWHASLRRGVARAQFARLALCYTAGESIDDLPEQLDKVILSYEQYAQLVEPEGKTAFSLNCLDDYARLMQLFGLCYLLHCRDLITRLVAILDGRDGTRGGRDAIVEEFLIHAQGAEARYATDYVSQLDPYEYLFFALTEETSAAQLKELNTFQKRWYKDLSGCSWHDSHKLNDSGQQGGYYGYWSFEAGAAVLLQGIEDDSSLHKYIYYPKDLVAWASENADRFADDGKSAQTKSRPNVPAKQPCPETGWWCHTAQANSRRYFKQDEIMPSVGGDYGQTFWQWSPDQTAPKL